MNEFDKDPEALALARRLAAVDFSLESRARYSLRTRLLGHRPLFTILPARWLVTSALTALILFIPVRMALRREQRYPTGANGLPELPGRLKFVPPTRSASVFKSVPAQPIFETRPAKPVFEALPASPVFETLPAMPVFETHSMSAVFEIRPTSYGEVFVKPEM